MYRMNNLIKTEEYECLINALQRNDYTIKRAIVCHAVPNPQRHVCTVGEKQFDRFFYVVKGNFHIAFNDGNEVTVSAGQMIYLHSDVEYVSEWDNDGERYYISFNFILEKTNFETENLYNKPFIISDGFEKNLYNEFNAAKAIYAKHDGFVGIALNGCYYKILYRIAKRIERKSIKAEYNGSEIYKAVVFLENKYLSEVTSEDLAEMCEMNVSTFRKIFKEHKGMSPMKYKNHLKMLYARELLESGLYTVSAVSEILNCSDFSHFNKLYKKEFGENPSKAIPCIEMYK